MVIGDREWEPRVGQVGENPQTPGPQKEVWNARQNQERCPAVLKCHCRDWLGGDTSVILGREDGANGSCPTQMMEEYFFYRREGKIFLKGQPLEIIS